ncbi:MAG TPA: ATP-dependent helicase [Ktedonobacterales bacterium]|nr:ATP-dependent helicase [Ktedonobacterales bacterium]
MPGRQTPEAVAATLLAWLREREPFADDTPTPLEALARRLDLDIESFDAAIYPGTLGFLEPGEDLIFLRADLPETVRRFTLAHELGHAALHRREGLAAEIAQGGGAWAWSDEEDSPSCDDSDLATAGASDDETLLPGQAYSARAQREGEANAFAAALLLPPASARAAYQSLCAEDVERPAQTLAQRFGVSEDAALRRLAALLRAPAETEAPDQPEPVIPSAPALDQHQLDAARAETPALILAGPGSGKTSALLARIVHLTQERGVAPDRVLALTYTRKAAGELRTRLTRVLGEQALMPRISTIHAFCGDVLRLYGPQVGLRADFRLITDVEGYFVLRHIINRAPLRHYSPLSDPKMHFRSLLNSISRAKDNLLTPEEYRAAAKAMARASATAEDQEAAERALEVAEVYAAYQATLDERGDADYGDLIARTWRLLREQPESASNLRARYEHILVDEYQDVNYATGALLRELDGGRGALWAVGDADQAIYRFRGASPANLLRFTREFEGARVIPLGRNYRSRPQILQAASAFAGDFLAGEQRITLEATRSHPDGPPAVELATAPDDEAELDGLANAIRARVAAGTPLGEQAILLRTNSYVRQVCHGLRARGIPVRIALPLLDQPLIKTLLATVSLAGDPSGVGLLRAGTTPDHAFSDDDAQAALRLARDRRVAPLEAGRLPEANAALSPGGAHSLRRLERVIAELRSAPSIAVGMGRYIFSLTGLGHRLLGEDARAEAAQVARLIEICHTFDDQRAAGVLYEDDGEGVPQMADWAGLLDYIGALRILGHEAGAMDSVSGDDTALVMTVHGAKGLEFSAVYLPQLVKDRFPARGRPEATPAPVGLLRDGEAGEDSDLIEEASAFYVALTRARDHLTLSYAGRYGKQNKEPAPFLAPIEQALGDDAPRLRWERATEDTNIAEDAGEPNHTAPAAHEEQVDHSPGERNLDAQPLTVTLSQLEAYARCPQQYAYQYVYGLRPAPGPLVSLRSALRTASAELATRFNSGATPTREEATALYRAHWEAARADALPQNDAGAVRERADSMASVYREHGERAIERVWRALSEGVPTSDDRSDQRGSGRDSVEVAVSVAGVTITGALDHVEQEPDDAGQTTTRVMRWQTGSLSGSPSLRDLFYALAVEEMRHEGQAAEAMRVSLANGEIKPLRVLAKRRKTLENEMGAALDGLAQASYAPRPDPRNCPTCPFALICPA